MGFIQTLADTAGGLLNQAAGGILGIAFQGQQDKRQQDQQNALQQIQIRGQKEMTDYNYEKQLQMWRDTNYPAQIEQLKKAGLNPALLYGMGGAGGASTSVSSGQVSGGTASGKAGEAIDMAGMGIQMGLMEAQRKVLESQARLNQVEADKKAGVDTKLGETQIQSLTQGIENQKAQQALTEVQTNIANIEEDIKGSTQNAAKALIFTQLNQATSVMNSLEANALIDKETYNTKINLIKQELVGKYLQNELNRANISLTQEQKNKVIQDVKNSIAEIDIKTAQQKLNDWAEHAKIDLGNKGLNILIIKDTIGKILEMGTSK